MYYAFLFLSVENSVKKKKGIKPEINVEGTEGQDLLKGKKQWCLNIANLKGELAHPG